MSWRRGIKELFTCEDILMKANRGFVVVVARENTSEGRDGAPQFITPLNVFDMKTLGIVTEVE